VKDSARQLQKAEALRAEDGAAIAAPPERLALGRNGLPS